MKIGKEISAQLVITLKSVREHLNFFQQKV